MRSPNNINNNNITNITNNNINKTKPTLLADMFSKARKHNTSDEGVEEIARYLKKYSRDDDDFREQFGKCSEAFRMYLDGRIEKILAII